MEFRRRTVVLWVAGVLAAFVVFYPVQWTVTPAWTIVALNLDGHGIAGCKVEQQWEWPAVGLRARAEITTDVGGGARFPPRTVRATLLDRLIGTVTTLNFHSSNGRSVQFFGCDVKNKPARLGIGQIGDRMTFEHRVPTVWQDSSMLK